MGCLSERRRVKPKSGPADSVPLSSTFVISGDGREPEAPVTLAG